MNDRVLLFFYGEALRAIALSARLSRVDLIAKATGQPTPDSVSVAAREAQRALVDLRGQLNAQVIKAQTRARQGVRP
ncbi:hypothetical protein [Paraconexibacter algicola]|uniref:Uncharacterized protein n=1 Tax=Paraconexibacter algicola TaxID=2133960 RepID=A0A2T4UDD4_9ACTN|nr:hypothetical protein [Paraconexibacter algicola]PTL55520.1 hypothetical protein C7Y72_17885 [Paraconexibacter algicola]